jgi:uncharacterized membrane protein YdjX (TVP38/TMEM64 family)
MIWLVRGALIVVLAIAIAVGLLFDWSFAFSIQEIESLIQSWGMWGVGGSIGLMVLHSFVPFPAEIVAIANGMVYGPFWGTVITWTGAMLGAFLAFGLARSLGRPFVERMVARKHWQSIDDWAAARGGRLVLIARFFPVIAFNLINYAAGLSRISWWTFTWATGIGILPLTVLMVVMGDRIQVLPWWVWPVLAVLCAAIWYLFRHKLHPAVSKGIDEADPSK